MVDLDTALGEQLLDISVGQAEAQVPADGEHDDVGRKWKPAKLERGGVDRRER
jgi:hypothetical protein